LKIEEVLNGRVITSYTRFMAIFYDISGRPNRGARRDAYVLFG